MNCIKGMIDLFGGTTACAATTLAVVSFVAGAVVTCLVCRLRRRCGGNKGDCPVAAPQKRQQRADPKFQKPHPAPADGSIEIYVGNLSYEMTEDQLRKEFEAYGKVNSARIITNRFNGKSKGFGFVHMPNRAEVDAAVAALSNKEVCGRRLKCNEAKNVG